MFSLKYKYTCKMIKGKTVGEGAYGKVYLATSLDSQEDESQKKSYALKRNIVESEVDFAGNLRELDILLRLKNHPNIVKIEQVIYGAPFSSGKLSPTRDGYKDDILHFVLEKADTDLHNFIYSSMQLTDLKSLLVDTLLGLEYMHHNNILHRDIKPGNLLLFFDVYDRNLPPKVKLCDFGLSKFYTSQEPQTPRMVTPWYRAPEIAMGCKDYDGKIDVWALGCVIYQMITHRGFVESRDNDMEILAKILKQLPKRLPPSETRKLKEDYSVRLPRGRRKAFQKELFPTSEDRENFERQVGSVRSFTALVSSMLQFFPNKRPTVTEVLDNPFFSDFADKIEESRRVYLYSEGNACFSEDEYRITIQSSQERKWAANLAFYFYNENYSKPNGLRWYKPRILFQAIDLFDRYLEYISSEESSPIRQKSTEKLFEEQVQTEIRFITCIYIAIKYFATLETPISYIDISENLFTIEGTQEFAQRFEKELLEKVFKYKVYRPTVFECADMFDDKLDETDIRNLLMIYGGCEAKNNIDLKVLYEEIRQFKYE